MSGLQAETRTDPLTGLANRRCLYERIEIEMAHALRSDTPLSVAMIDLDHFKQYNDSYGHVAGDALLRGIAALMVSNVRGQDLVVPLRRRGVLPGDARHRSGRGSPPAGEATGRRP